MKKLKKAGCIFMSANMLLTTVAATTSMADYINNSDVLAGKNRYETANKIAQRYFKKADTVILVNGDAVADALSVAPLAKKLDAPILLTDTNKMDAQTEKILKDYNPNKIIIIGGQNSVSKNLEAKLKGILAKASIERIDGKNRIDTSMIIANKLGLSTKGAFIVNGFKGLPDAASAGACAAKEGMPLIFVGKNMDMYKSMIEKFNLQKLYLIGGTSSISPEFDIKDKTERLAGKNRRDTNLAILEKFYNTGVKEAFIAKDGMNNVSQLIDSVTIGGIAGKFNMPIILGSVTGGLTQGQLDYIKSKNFEKFIGVGFGNYEAGAQLKGLGKGYSLENLVKETQNKDTDTKPVNTSNSKKKSKDKKKDEKTPKQIAEEKLKSAEEAKNVVDKAITEAGDVINPTEKEKIEKLIKDYNTKKEEAKKAVEALTPKDVELENKEKALTEVNVPEVNDKNSNGIKDDLEEAVTNAEKEINALQFESDAEKQKAVEAIKKANTVEEIKKITADIKTVNNVNEQLKQLVEKVNKNITDLGSMNYNPKTYETVVTMEFKGIEKAKDIFDYSGNLTNTGFISGLQNVKELKSYIIENISPEKINIQDSEQDALKNSIILDIDRATTKFSSENLRPGDDPDPAIVSPEYGFANGKEMIVPIKAFIGENGSIERIYTFKIKASEKLKKFLKEQLDIKDDNLTESDSVARNENNIRSTESINTEALSTFNTNHTLRSRRVARSVASNEAREDTSIINTDNETGNDSTVNDTIKEQDKYIKEILKKIYGQTIKNKDIENKKIFLSMLDEDNIINFAINPDKNSKAVSASDLQGTGLKTVLENLMDIKYMKEISFNNETPKNKSVYKGSLFNPTAKKVARKVISPIPKNYGELVGRNVPFEIFCEAGGKEFSRKFLLKFTNDYDDVLNFYQNEK